MKINAVEKEKNKACLSGGLAVPRVSKQEEAAILNESHLAQAVRLRCEPVDRVVAPYISYRTFRTFLGEIHEELPPWIDRDVLRRFNGSVKNQLLSALRFLGLITENSEPTNTLDSLRKSFETDGWRPALLKLLNETYAPIMDLARRKPTRHHLEQEFRKLYPSKQETIRKQVTFFVKAATDAGVKFGKRMDRRTRSRSSRRLGSAKNAPYGDTLGPVYPGSKGRATDPAETTKTIEFQSGGSLTVSVAVDLLKLHGADREFLFNLLDQLDVYESQKE